MNSIPSSPNDPVNTDILMVAEDRVKGFRRFPSMPFPSNAATRSR